MFIYIYIYTYKYVIIYKYIITYESPYLGEMKLCCCESTRLLCHMWVHQLGRYWARTKRPGSELWPFGKHVVPRIAAKRKHCDLGCHGVCLSLKIFEAGYNIASTRASFQGKEITICIILQFEGRPLKSLPWCHYLKTFQSTSMAKLVYN